MSGPSAADPELPNAARVHDHLLGGACDFEPDRVFADPLPAIRRRVDALAPGSFLAITHGSTDTRRPGFESVGRRCAEALIDGLDLVEPGVVWAPLWHPDTDPGDIDPRESPAHAVVGRRR